jgi:hypothetical protein
MARTATSRTTPPRASEAADEAAYTVHDFSQMNRHVDDLFGRAHSVTWQRRMDVYRRFAWYSGGILLSAGFFILLAGLAYWLAFAPPKPETKIIEIEKPLIVEKEKVVTIDRPVPMQSDVVANLRRIEDAVSRDTKAGENPNVPVVRNYTVFSHVEHKVDGIDVVVTGARFESSTSDHPSFQYCYVDLPVAGMEATGSDASQNFRIANRNGRLPVSEVPITSDMARKIGTTMSALRSARSKCRFM